MKQDQIIQMALKGHCMLVGTYVGTATDGRDFFDAKSGRTRPARWASHTLLAGVEPVIVREYLPDGCDLEQQKFPYQAGKKYVVVVSSMAEDKGVKRASLNGVPMSELE